MHLFLDDPGLVFDQSDISIADFSGNPFLVLFFSFDCFVMRYPFIF